MVIKFEYYLKTFLTPENKKHKKELVFKLQKDS